MAAYAFETITAAQAGSFSAANDTLSFSATTTARAIGVVYGGTGASITVGDRTVSFGSGFVGYATSFQDGTRLFVGGAAADVVSGGTGADEALGGDGADTLAGLDGGDSLNGGAGDDSLSGGSGDDVLQDGPGADTLDGGAGVDVVSFSSASTGLTLSVTTLIQTGVGADRFSNIEGIEGGASGDQLSGDGQGNILRGGGGDDSLQGLAGDDTLEGGRGDDIIDGGEGSDTLVFTNPTGGQFVNLETTHTISFDSGLGQDTLVGVENVITGAFNDVIVGDALGNRLITLAGADSVQGGGGADTIDTGDGADTVTGGDGFDSITTGAGSDSIAGGDGSDRIIGGAGADTMDGGLEIDIFEFSAGDSPITGLFSALDRINFFGDLLVFHGGVAPTEANYAEATAGLEDTRGQAQTLYAQGYEYIAIQQGGNVEVFVPRLSIRILLENSSLDGISVANLRVDSPVTQVSTTPTAGGDVLAGAGNDTIDGLAGSDTVTETSGTNYLRGGDGDDSIQGGTGFDDVNGNMGNDTCVSGGGDDWMVGGKDNDSLVGSAGQNLVYGNLGQDTCEGGDGNDIVRGGQDADIVRGGNGDDFVSGDKGDDTMTGGAGADIFHTFGDAGIDRVTDFNLAQGDRVQLDPGTQYTVSQPGFDTIINMTGGGQMILVGVSMSSLTGNWIFGA